jgi:hypothetical protein
LKIKTLNDNAALNYDDIGDDYFDLLVVGFGGDERIRYAKELRGETNVLKNLAAATEEDKALIYAADTDNYGIIKHSAAVFENGKLLGISDMTTAYSDTPYMPGANGKLYDMKFGKIGLAVGDDLLSYDLMRSFAVCGADAVIAITRLDVKETDAILVRAYSYLLGLPFLLVGSTKNVCSDPKGNLTAKDENGAYTLTPLRDYALKTVKIRFERN